jgi:hypothetical protein
VLPAIAQAEKLFASALGEITLTELVRRADAMQETGDVKRVVGLDKRSDPQAM